jgi:peptidoglycan/xylan/chitin deacetylase (PgdA/CDA1 family)
LSYPESVESLVADGHEIGHHGWVHEALSPLSEEERSVIERGIEVLESVAGARPRGFRAPGFDLLSEYDRVTRAPIQSDPISYQLLVEL